MTGALRRSARAPRLGRLPAILACLALGLPGYSGAAPGEPSGDSAGDLGMVPEHVVLLHGLARTDRSMAPLAERLALAGYRVFNVGYPSRSLSPQELVAVLRTVVEDCCADARRISFVTHSLGGILVRALLAEAPDPRLGRVVMMSPPNRGTDLVDIFGDTRWFRALMGPTAAQMGTEPGSLPRRLPEADFELGIIAATGSIVPLGSLLIAGEDDGIVPLCSMWLEGATDALIVPQSHALMMRSDAVIDQVLTFLRDGHFDHAGEPPPELPRECEPGEP